MNLEYTDSPSQEAMDPAIDTDGRLVTVEGKASDAVAVLLSMLPGLGHIYKGHKVIGLILIFFGTPFAIGIALLIATGTAGFGIGLLPIYWIAVMIHVYAIQDRVVTGTDEGEEY
jgi:apolipoprotein N-acyltransferase